MLVDVDGTKFCFDFLIADAIFPGFFSAMEKFIAMGPKCSSLG